MSKRNRKSKAAKPRVLVLGSGSAAEAVRRAGAEAVIVGTTDERAAEAAAHDNLHGLLLNGGGDVSPALYGGNAKDRTVYGVSERRDLVEMYALDAARERGIPVLGICRGAQLMNVHAGGTLVQDIGRDASAHRFHVGHDHRVKIRRGTRLAKAMRVDEPWVISIHHQAVGKVAPGMKVVARSSDGIVEAVESRGSAAWELGVQFHPEMARQSVSQSRIFSSFVEACGDRAGIAVRPQAWRREPKRAMPVAERVPMVPETATRRAREMRGTWGGPINVSWRCFRGCRDLVFDVESDYVDHLVMLHGVTMDELEVRSVG